ncbi:hypothetical protein YC2023_004397 [Brassica napus]
MEEERNGQNLRATLSQQSAALQKLQLKIAQLEKKNKAQGQRPHEGERRFGDVPGAVYVEPKPPDPSRINQTPTSKTHNSHVINYRYPTHGSKEARRLVEQEGQRVLSQQDNFQPNQGHAIIHCLDQKSDIPKVRKMSTSVGQNTLIRSKDKPEQAIVQVKAKSVITCLKEPRYIEEEAPGTNLPMDQKEAQSTKQSKLLNKLKPVIKCLTPPLDTGLNIFILGTGIPDESHMLTGVPRAEPDHELNQNPHHKWKPKSEQCGVQVPKSEVNSTLDQNAIINSMTRLMHLSCPRESERITGSPGDYTVHKEETPTIMFPLSSQNKEFNTGPMEHEFIKEDPKGGEIISQLFKEEPPDASCITKPKLYQGKVIQFRGRIFVKGEGMMRPSDQQLNQRSTQSSTQPAKAPTRTYVN